MLVKCISTVVVFDAIPDLSNVLFIQLSHLLAISLLVYPL